MYEGPLKISALREAYSSGQTTPSDVVRACYARIEAFANRDAIFIALRPLEDTLKAVAELESKYASSAEKPALYGIPFSVKNSIDVEGYLTTMACESFAYMATKTAPCVQRVLDAGGIFVGTTNLDQFATGLTGRRSPYGTPTSVFDEEYISGGSSSGSAVSVGKDFVSFSIGTDTAGSTRIPAAYNGLVGLKPTLGTISTVGLIPACKTADCVTVLSKTVQDARIAYSVMNWFDLEDDFAREHLPPRPALAVPAVRFGVPPADLLQVLQPEYSDLFKKALERLETKAWPGSKRVKIDYAPFEQANGMLYGSSIVAQRLDAFKEYLAKHGMSKLHPVIREIFEASSGWDATKAYTDLFTLAHYRRKAEIQFRENMDILVVPSTARHWKVSEIDEEPLGRNKLNGSFSHFVNLLDLSAIAIPAGTWKNPKGRNMPFSITLIGQAGRDEELMQLAERFLASAN